jgi:hypothetical protein
MTTISLETLKNGNIRVTSRVDGRTVGPVAEGQSSDAKKLVESVLSTAAPHHRIGNGYDMTYIRLNDAAKLAIA